MPALVAGLAAEDGDVTEGLINRYTS